MRKRRSVATIRCGPVITAAHQRPSGDSPKSGGVRWLSFLLLFSVLGADRSHHADLFRRRPFFVKIFFYLFFFAFLFNFFLWYFWVRKLSSIRVVTTWSKNLHIINKPHWSHHTIHGEPSLWSCLLSEDKRWKITSQRKNVRGTFSIFFLWVYDRLWFCGISIVRNHVVDRLSSSSLCNEL